MTSRAGQRAKGAPLRVPRYTRGVQCTARRAQVLGARARGGFCLQYCDTFPIANHAAIHAAQLASGRGREHQQALRAGGLACDCYTNGTPLPVKNALKYRDQNASLMATAPAFLYVGWTQLVMRLQGEPTVMLGLPTAAPGTPPAACTEPITFSPTYLVPSRAPVQARRAVRREG